MPSNCSAPPICYSGAPVPLDSCPARVPLRMTVAGATRRCFDLLGASRRGVMRLCGERLMSVGVP